MYPLEIEMRDIFPISRATLSADISAESVAAHFSDLSTLFEIVFCEFF